METLQNIYFKRQTVFGEKEILGYRSRELGLIPKIVFKYLDLSLNYNRDCLINNYIWFSDPTLFNDPFDCKIPFAYHLLAEDEFLCRDYYESNSRLSEPHLTDEERKLSVDRNVNLLLTNKGNLGFFKKLQNRRIEDNVEILKETGVFCTCMINDNILLWSHYANSHKGVCIALKTEELLKLDLNVNFGACEVQYGDFPDLLPLSPTNATNIANTLGVLFSHKAIFWNYELEYRFMELFCDRRKKPLNNALDSIYMGYNISKEDEMFIREICKTNNGKLKLYRAEKGFSKYELEFNEKKY